MKRENPEMFGRRFRICELGDGRFVAERWSLFWGWRGLDLRSPGYVWSVDSIWYSHCVGSREHCLAALAEHGVLKVGTNA